MRQYLLFIIYYLSMSFLNAQTKNDYLTLIYQIQPEEYFELQKGAIITEKHLHTLIDSTDKFRPHKFYGLGYFIKVYPNLENLKLSVFINTSISAILRHNKRDLMLTVMDSLGNNLIDAEVTFKNKRIPYNEKTKTYRLKKWKEQLGHIIIKAKGEVVFYKIEKEGYRYGGYDKPIIYRLKAPIRGFRRMWVKVNNIIQYGEWFTYRDRKYNGYLAMNQPKYRPNDTLKIKGYFTNKRGKPLKRPLKFTIKNNSEKRFSKMVEPIEKGVYLLELPLDDSLNLRLDKQGVIMVADERKWNDFQVKRHRFDYEDYQLDEVDYTLETSNKSYAYGEKVMIKATGKFKTGTTIPDGMIHLKLLTKYTAKKEINDQQFFDKKVIVKNLLWETRLALSSKEPTQILVPDSIFPKVALPIYVDATFSNSNGEIQYKNTTFTIEKPKIDQPLSLKLEGAHITANVKNGFLQKNPIVEWFIYKKDKSTTATRLVQLPHTERVNGNLLGYDISYLDNSDLVPLFLTDNLDQVAVEGKHKGNKINILFHNPRRLSITFQLYKGKSIVESFQSDQAKIRIDRNAVINKNYLLKYQYVWASHPIEKEERFIYLKKKLKITIEQPETIIPGQQVPIKIKVKNQKDQAIKGVNLTAGAINGQFNTNSHFTELEVPYKLSKNPKTFHNISLQEELLYPITTKPITKKWVKKTRVAQQLFYQLRFPESGVYIQYDTVKKTEFHQNIAQFAPYLVKNGSAQPIYLIYCNKKLVYYYDVDDQPPYAFVGKAGYNAIQIRTLNYTYVIDSVLLKKGQKLEFSIDVDHFEKHQTQFKIRKKAATPLMTPLERRIIAQSIFALHPEYGINQIFQDSSSIHIFPHNGYSPKKIIKIGPFLPHKELNYIHRDYFKNTFYFEPHFRYKIQENRERLYEFNFLKDKEFFPKTIGIKFPKERVFAPSNIVEKTPKDTSDDIIYHSLSRRFMIGFGQIQFQLKGQLKDSLIAILWEPEGISPYTLRPRLRKLEDQSGNYQLTFIKIDSTYAKIKVEIRENELLFLNHTDIRFKKDNNRKIFQKISVEPPKRKDLKLSQSDPSSKAFIPINYTSFPITISGTVTDDSGDALIGASVLIKGTTVGTVTDIDGSYTINVPNSDYTLNFSYTGYASEEVTMNPNKTILDVVLTQGMLLEEVVVTGLGIRKEKKALGYSVSTITANALSGKITGVSITENKKQKRLSLLHKNLPATNQLRSNFKDYAFWQPNLVTDQYGEAVFTAVFPDNLTQWQTFVIGMNRKQQVGLSSANVNAFKPLVAQLAVPRFMLEGDESAVIGKAINFTDDSLSINTLFKINNKTTKTNSAIIQDALIEKLSLKAGLEKDSLTINYQLKNRDYGDGEKRKIPIFPKGVIEHSGQFHLLDKDTILLLDFLDKNLPITIRIEGNLRNILMENVDYLIAYPHGCNEQTASKLLALLLAKRLKKLQGKPFLHEKYIRKGIQRLDNAQHADGSWGWWKGGQQNIWMTTYVLKALHAAKEAGYSSNSYKDGLILLTNNLSNCQDRDLLNTLELFAGIGQKGDYESWINQLDTGKLEQNLNNKLTLLKIKQAYGLPFTLDTLEKYQQVDIFGNLYWGRSNYHWYNTDIQNSLLAYEIYKKAKEEIICKKIKGYIIRQKNRQGWGNTFQTAKVLATFLGDNIEENKQINSKSELSIETIDNQSINKFPFQYTYSKNTPILIHKKGTAPIYISAYQTFLNKNPSAKSDLFEVKSSLQQNGKPVAFFSATVPATLEVTVKVKRKTEYVLIEVPIPAGCSYGAKTQPKSWYANYGRYQKNHEVQREYFKEKVAIYCKELPTGNYRYIINLEPRFSGRYTLNPAKAEEMYFPVFYGRNAIKEVEIGEE